MSSRTFANDVDDWSVFLAQYFAANKALSMGDVQTAKIMGVQAIAGLGTFCNPRYLPEDYFSDGLRDLVADYFTISSAPEYASGTVAIRGNHGC